MLLDAPLRLWILFAAQGLVKPDAREFDASSADRRFHFHGALQSNLAAAGDAPCPFSGHGTYELFDGGTRLWQRTFHFALAEARVLADGTVAGLAYTESQARDQDCATYVVLAPNGAPRLEQRLPVEVLGRDPAGCIQVPRGWFVDEAHGRFVAWIWSEPAKREQWNAWSLSTGKAVEWRPRLDADPNTYACAGAEPVPGTGLVLVHAWRRSERATLYRSEFDLVDADGLRVWSYAVDADRVEGEAGRAAPGANGIVSVAGGEKPTLRLRCFTDKSVVRFELAQDATTKAWSAREVGKE